MSKDTIHVFNNLNIKGVIANGEIGTAGQVLHSNGTATYWAIDENAGGTVTSVATANGLSGGPITTTGTLGVVSGSTLTVNVSGIHVNTANLSIATSQLTGDIALGANTSGNYVATITAGNGISGSSTSEGGTPTIAVVAGRGIASNSIGVHVIVGNSTVISNTLGVYVNAAALSIATSQLTGDVALGTNTSGNYVATITNANGISGSSSAEGGTPTIGVVTGSSLTVNTSGIHVNSALSITDLALSGNLIVSGSRTYINTTTLEVGDNIVTLNANLGANPPTENAGIEIMRGTSANVQFIWDETNDRWSTNGQPIAISSLVAAGAASGITTLAAGNTTITGFVNVNRGISLANSTSNIIDYAAAGVAAPTTTTLSSGTKLLLYPALSSTQSDYAIGIDAATLWHSVPVNSSSFKFKWFGAATEVAFLDGGGNFKISGYANVTGSIQGGSSLTIAGAASGITTLAAGNTTITGFANVTGSITSTSTSGIRVEANDAQYRLTTAGGQGWRIGTTSTSTTHGKFYIQGSIDGFVSSFINAIDINTSGGVVLASTVSGITTLAAGNTTITGFANVAGNILSRNLLMQGDNTNAYIRPTNTPSNLYLGANNTNIVTIFANGNLTTSSSLTVAGPVSGITTLASGNTTITGFASATTEMRSPIFKDSDNTAYYLDPASTGTSLVVAGNVGIGTTAPLTQLTVPASILVTSDGGYYGGGAYYASAAWRNSVAGQGGYAIRNSAGVYTVFTGASTAAAGTAFTSFAERMRIDGTGNVGIGNTAPASKLVVAGAVELGNTVVTGFASATTEMRAPIFKDSDNAAYYGDFAGTSVLNAAIVNGTRASFVLGSLGVGTTVRLLSIEGNYDTGQYAHRFRKEDVGGGVPLSLDYSGGTAGSYTQLVQWGPFSGDGGYFIRHQASTRIAGNLMVKRDANSTNVGDSASIVLSNRNTSINGGIMGGIFADTFRDVADPHYSAGMWFTRVQQVTNLSSSSEIVFGTMISGSSTALPTERMRINTAGNIIAAVDMRAPIFYDSVTPAYYLDPAGTSNLYRITLNPGTSGVTTGLYINGGDITAARTATTGAIYLSNGGSSYIYFDGSSYEFGSSGFVTSSTSMRAPIFYNTPDTAYYVNPDSTSNLYGLTVNQVITGSVTGYSTYLPTRYDSGQKTNPQTYFGQSIGLRVAMTAMPVVWADTLWINGYAGGDVLDMCALHFSRQGTPKMWISTQQSTATSYGTFYELPSFGYNSGNTGDLYAGIFKDSNNSAYYVDSDSTSRMNTISLDQVNVGDGTFLFKTGANSGVTRHLNLSTYAGDPSQAQTGQSGITWGARSDNEAYYMIYLTHGDYSAHTKLSLSWHTGIRIGAAAAYGGTAFYANSLNVNPALLFTVGRGDDNVRSLTTFRAPIMYDIDNGAYYVDPASTSNLLGLTVTNTITGSVSGTAASAGRLYTNTGTNNSSLQYWQLVDNATLNPDTSYYYGLRMGHGDADTYYNATLVASFFADNLYMRRKVGGTDQTWRRFWHNGDSSITASADFRAPIFYDTTNTAYYWNFASSAVSNIDTQITGFAYFLSNRNTTSNSPPLQCYSNDAAQGAIMSFHRSGIYAINMGLDSDNIFRIAGWSAATNAFQMDGSGNLTMLGNVTAYSDVRKKKDITTIENALDMVTRMRGVRFRRIDTDQLGVGVIAQEMLEVLPEVVQQGIGDDDTMSVAYGNIVGVLIEAIKEQQAHINKLETKINSLEQRLI